MRTKWAWFLLILLIVCNPSVANTSDRDIRLLNNRFRVDSTISQVAFIIYRKQSSHPVVLIQPDGTKLYAWRHPKNVSWHQESDRDIVSVLAPMPGPWQAIGKVTPENKIRILSELNMKVNSFPARLYQGETIKFTAQLMQADSPLNFHDFLNSVELTVTFTELIDGINDIPVDQRPQERLLGKFKDTGTELDEVAGDGIFTVKLPINVQPGKYHARVASGNNIFLRTLEQEVFVYPTPLMATFKQSKQKALPHNFFVESDAASIEPGTIAMHVEFLDTNGKLSVYQGQAIKEYTRMTVDIDNFDVSGRHKWHAWLYGTDKLLGRPLVFALPEQTFVVADYEAIEKATFEREVREIERAQEEEKRLATQRRENRTIVLITIIVGNIFVLALALLTWFINHKVKANKLAIEIKNELKTSSP
ncbi:TIGR03503 family protein [Candidatus Enterovibrio altilux]|uniref:TIGR03503 family protein n=2 Tax=Candidatus Enterovibrio altilux TaxID=1927128 RepID=A0A291B895_9GAMM|nr:TIGR03503 family protein [Candidatus Enterovibrio luxaltus]ATF09234.1 Hypothetical protein BTN50_0719 [Candidatus Enterovibrio luxaltus]